MTYLSILGRQPELGLAELRAIYGQSNVQPFAEITAVIESSHAPNVEALGGSIKLGEVIHEIDTSDWHAISQWIHNYYTEAWKLLERKQTIGISVYGLSVSPKLIQKIGLQLKSSLKTRGVSVRLIPNTEPTLSSAVSHHNKLGLSENKTELLIVSNGARTIIAESLGAQNITALAARDQTRPKTDAFVGMLPPKLALMMINLSGIAPKNNQTILDPFCGTGVVLQEALLRGYNAYGTDLSEKMIDYSQANLEWLIDKYRLNATFTVHHGDAIETQWQQPVDAVVSEVYLGQPFSAPPAPDKLEKVMGITGDITTRFLRNLSQQLTPGTPVCLAVPAWRDSSGKISRLPVANKLASLGYVLRPGFENLYYYREDQVVARELIVAEKQ